ncbi:PREDICTED: cytochrome P450 4C1-like [Nicrophorus vespilloides]|uniref:Cytochrome P450 4C1-like n=1 Tax=Nicrophorus vespilloides TaxID=110193 RepID=A0ABM1MUG7_NICVS|nr:PREDICTED: cytochrome P450 4C1-like [Nicrophorus vespilloides]
MYSIVKSRSFLLNLGLMNILLIAISVLLVFWYFRWRQSRKHLYEAAAKVPASDCIIQLPILGHSLYFIGDTEQILINLIHITSKSSKTPCSVWLAHRLFFLLNKPEQMEVVLNSPKCLEKDDLYRFSKPLIGHGLFNLNVDTWKIHRKLIMPSFNQRLLDQFVDVFVEQSNVLTNTILSKKVGKFFDVEEYITAAALEMVIQTAMGIKTNNQESNCELAEQFTRGLEIMFMRMFNFIFHSDFLFNLTSMAKEERTIVNSFQNFIRTVIADKRASLKRKEQEMKQSIEAEIGEFKERKVFLDHLIELSQNQQLTDQEMIEEVQTFMIGGSDTSATVVSFVLICLGMFPEYQQLVYEEILEVVGLDRDIECTDIAKFKYLEKFIKETMRLFPIGPNIVRKVTEDLELDGHILPKDSGLVLGIFSIHRNEKYYPNHMKFDPERFSPKETAKRHPYAYLPFSAGPRNCAGVKFGMSVVKTIVATVTRKYFIETTFKSIEDVRIKQSLIIKSCLDGQMLPKGSGLVLAIFSIHRNDKFYPNHMEFDPERNCVGIKFGMTVVKTIVATVTRKYFIETSFKRIEDVRVKQSLIIKSCLGFPIKLTERDTTLVE